MEGGWDFQAQEERDGLRFSWNEWPPSKVEASRMVVPLACLYTPLKQLETLKAPLEYEPVRCKKQNCGAILNPYSQVDFLSKHWTCPFCFNRNVFPPQYAEQITETNLPAELYPQFTTVEYAIPGKVAGSPAFLFVVDACVPEDELNKLKESISQALMLLPPTALVGLISYGTMVQVHELSSAECPRSFVFKGTKEYDASQVASLLGLSAGSASATGTVSGAGAPGAPGGISGNVNRFLVPVAEGAYVLEQILSDLQKDPWPKPADQRPARATGTALSVAESLLERTIGRSGGRIMLFMGGPCTDGPGAVVNRSLVETMRQHSELSNNKAPFFKEACKFYKNIADRAAANAHSIDVFACSLDQVGLLELRPCITSTGGVCVLADAFTQSVFFDSFKHLFKRFQDASTSIDPATGMPIPSPAGAGLQMGFAATLECLTSRDFKISGALGPCASLRKPSPSVSDVEIGESGTFAWSLGGLDPSTSIAIFFDVVAKDAAAAQAQVGRRHHLQLLTYYQHADGRYRLRVTTTAGMWSNGTDSVGPNSSIAASFDQEAAAVIMARIAVNRMEQEDSADVLRWLDRSLIRVCSKFAEYRKDDASSFRLGPNFTMFPQFMFHLRRSQFIQTFNMSPDEGCYNRLIFNRETTGNALVMIQPSLICYSFNGTPQPVLLDATSVRPDAILLFDSFFLVLVFHGETIAAWRDAKYQDLPEHEAFRQLLAAPQTDAALIMGDRFPVPRYIKCDQHKSQARFLMAKLNPSVTQNNIDGTTNAAGGPSAPVFTDDVSFGVFLDHLIKFAVQS